MDFRYPFSEGKDVSNYLGKARFRNEKVYILDWSRSAMVFSVEKMLLFTDTENNYPYLMQGLFKTKNPRKLPPSVLR